MTTTDTAIAATAAGISAIAGGLAWHASRKANATAAAVARIEEDRWHTELVPNIQLTRNGDTLELTYVGPPTLGPLRIRPEIRDDRDRSVDRVLAGGPTREELAEVIWGPCRFRPGNEGADERGRTTAPFRLEPGDSHKLAIDPSPRPSWMEGVDGERRWRRDYQSAPIRLWLICEADGHKPWRLPVDVHRFGAATTTPADGTTRR
ncbi:hypothetical protein EV284_6359 [Streptomyces sp. BK022]|uniref:hypothetical protein n=1 Tax=Streptomyces sp. BK022 TaxID=2512123 RepID=UPI0010296A55|nr:hypothetical protein [Streptomyces sp. BK022]RZU28193.1 hypothetical protein EV284_6359 [Streptomyces sp. BK022]